MSKHSSFRTRILSNPSSASTAVMTFDDRPIYSSPNFAGSYSSTVIRLLPPLLAATSESTSSRCALYAFSNRGYLLTAALRINAEGGVEIEGAEETVGEVKANDVEFADFEDGGDGRKRRRAVVWERAGNRLVILEQTEVRDSYSFLSRRVPRSSVPLQDSPLLRDTASLELDRSRPSLLPTAISFLSPNIFLVGSIRGHLSLFQTFSSTGLPTASAGLREIARLEKVHDDTINRIHIRHRRTFASAEWTVETVARDGASCLLEVNASETPSLRLVDRRQLTKGWLEDVGSLSR